MTFLIWTEEKVVILTTSVHDQRSLQVLKVSIPVLKMTSTTSTSTWLLLQLSLLLLLLYWAHWWYYSLETTQKLIQCVVRFKCELESYTLTSWFSWWLPTKKKQTKKTMNKSFNISLYPYPHKLRRELQRTALEAFTIFFIQTKLNLTARFLCWIY